MKKKRTRCDIFISYRRDGGEMTARSISKELKQRRYDVFFDREGLRAPGLFNERLLTNIQSCKDFVLILSPHALDRCVNEDDWVRREIEEAYKQKKNIVPIMMGGFEFPAELPESIKQIRYEQALLPSMDYFDECIDRLCKDFLSSKPHHNPLKAAGVLLAAIMIALFGACVVLYLTSGQKPIGVDVRSQLKASGEIQLKTSAGSLLELYGDTAPVDLGGYPKGSYYSLILTLKNTGSEDVSYTLSSVLDGEKINLGEGSCAAGKDEQHSISGSIMETHMTPGKHSIAWYVNGRKISTFKFTFTEEKRPDLRETLKAAACLAVFDAQGEYKGYVDGTSGNLQDLPEGGKYVAALALENQGEDRVRFHFALIDDARKTWYLPAALSLSPGSKVRYKSDYILNKPGSYRLTWYVEGYPVSTQSYTITDEVDVRGQLEATAEFQLITPQDDILELYSGAAPLDLGEYPEGSYYNPALRIKNTGSETVSYRLYAVLDGEKLDLDEKKTCAPGYVNEHRISAPAMKRHLTPGKHTIDWYVNGYKIKTSEFEFTEEKRPDLRETLKATTCLAVFDAQDKFKGYVDGTSGNLQELPEGGQYRAALMLENQGEEDVQFHQVVMDNEGNVGFLSSLVSVAGGETDEHYSYALSEPGDHELTWYVEGYPVLTQTYTITDEVDVRGQLKASVKFELANSEGYALERRGNIVPLDLGEYPKGTHYSLALTLKNTGSEAVSYKLSAVLDGEELHWDDEKTCAAGDDKSYPVKPSAMEAHLTPGKHAITWYVNGYEIKTFTFEFTEEKRRDLRGTLKATPCLAIYDAQDRLQKYVDGTSGNLQALPEGGWYRAILTLENQGEEDVQFYLTMIDKEGHGNYYMAPRSVAKGEKAVYGGSSLNTPGVYEMTWYADGYPILTEAFTIAEKVDVRAQLKADMEIKIETSEGKTLERFGDTVPMDMSVYPQGSHYSMILTLKNTGKEDASYTLSVLLDGEELDWHEKGTCAPGKDKQYEISASAMEERLTPGKHFITWYVNDYEFETFEFELTEEKRQDLRDTLKATARLAIFDARDRLQSYVDGTSGNLRDLPEGGRYSTVLTLENQGKEDVQLHLTLMDDEENVGFWMPSIAKDAFSNCKSNYPMSKPGKYKLTWYAEGYPLLTQIYTITDEAAPDVRDQLEAEMEIVLCTDQGEALELCGDILPLDMGEYPEGSYYQLTLTLKNTGSEEARYTLSAVLDGDELSWDEDRCAAGDSESYSISASSMRAHLTPGKHSIAWYVNGYELQTFELELTEEKRPDLRETLKATTYFGVYNAQEEPQYYIDGTIGSLRDLQEGERYAATLTLENQGEEAVQFHLALMDKKGHAQCFMSSMSLARGETLDCHAGYPMSEPGEYELTWYAEGYPILTQTYTVTDEAVSDVRDQLEANAEIRLYTSEDNTLELCGDKVPLDLGEYPEGSYYSPYVTLRNTGSEDVSYMLSAALDGEDFYWDGPEICAAGTDEGYFLRVSDMEEHLTPGRHSITWYVNGREIKTLEFEFTQEKRPDLRETLKATTCLAVYNAQGERQRNVEGTVGNLQALKEGEYYLAVLTLKNQGDEEAQFHLVSIDKEGSGWYWESPQSIAKGAIDKYDSAPFPNEPGDYELTWYAEGYPVLTQTYTIIDQPDLRDQFEASTEFAVINYEGQILEHCGGTAPLDLGDYPEGSYYSLILTIKNTGSWDVDYVLSVVMDEEATGGAAESLAAGDDAQISITEMGDHLTPGRHSIIWSVNGYEIETLDFEFTEAKRPDLRETLKATGTLCVCDADGKLLYYTNSVSGNVRELPEGASYGLCLRLKNQAETDAEFPLMFIADGQSQTKSWPEPQRIGAKAEDVWQGDYRITSAEEHKLTWYAQGYPILTQRYTIKDEEMEDVRGNLSATPSMRVLKKDGSVYAQPAGMGFDLAKDIPEGGCASCAVSLRNTGEERMTLRIGLVVDQEAHTWQRTIGAGETQDLWMPAETARRLMTPGEHAYAWYANGYPLQSGTYTVTDSSAAH